MAKNITLLGANYPDVPAVTLPQTGGGTATFYDISTVSFTATTSGSGNLSKQFDKKVIVLSAYANIADTGTSDVVVAPFPAYGADEDGQTTWWFNCYFDNASHSALANQSVTIVAVYIERG